MAMVDGSDFVLNINTGTEAVPVWTPIANVQSYSRKSTRPTSKKPVFMKATAISGTGPLEESITLRGIFTADDAGQLRLISMKAADAAWSIQALFDGINGYKQLVKVSDFSVDETPDDFPTFTATLEAEADAVVVAAGPIA